MLAALGRTPPARARCSSASLPRPAPIVERAEAKRVRKGVDLIVLNDVSRSDIGFDVDDNEVALVAADGVDARAARAQARDRGAPCSTGSSSCLRVVQIARPGVR